MSGLFKMATWDDVFIDVHSSQKPDETEVIPALGQGRGKPTKDITCIALPKAALEITKEKQSIPWTTSGRGRASLVKARALTASPPIRRPGEKVDKQPSNIFNVKYLVIELLKKSSFFLANGECLLVFNFLVQFNLQGPVVQSPIKLILD